MIALATYTDFWGVEQEQKNKALAYIVMKMERGFSSNELMVFSEILQQGNICFIGSWGKMS